MLYVKFQDGSIHRVKLPVVHFFSFSLLVLSSYLAFVLSFIRSFARSFVSGYLSIYSLTLYSSFSFFSLIGLGPLSLRFTCSKAT